MTTATTTRKPGRPANKSGGQAPALSAEQVGVDEGASSALQDHRGPRGFQ